MTWAEWFNRIREYAFGEMNLSPEDFYEMRIEDFILKTRGFQRARVREERLVRRLAEFTIAPHIAKGSPSIMALWPISLDEELKSFEEERRKQRAKQLSPAKREWLRKAAANRDVNINPQFN